MMMMAMITTGQRGIKMERSPEDNVEHLTRVH